MTPPRLNKNHSTPEMKKKHRELRKLIAAHLDQNHHLAASGITHHYYLGMTFDETNALNSTPSVTYSLKDIDGISDAIVIEVFTALSTPNADGTAKVENVALSFDELKPLNIKAEFTDFLTHTYLGGEGAFWSYDEADAEDEVADEVETPEASDAATTEPIRETFPTHAPSLIAPPRFDPTPRSFPRNPLG
jgi:hypothetical protein